MSSLSIVILVCGASLGHADCSEQTARTVMRAPMVESAASCGFLGQAQVAATAVGDLAEGEYLKVVCVPRGQSRTAALDPAAE
jgi:hypothetical protein